MPHPKKKVVCAFCLFVCFVCLFLFCFVFVGHDIILILIPVSNPGLSIYSQPANITKSVTLICSAVNETFSHDITFKRNNSDICTCSRRRRPCTNHTSSDQYSCTFDYEVKKKETEEYPTR